MEHPRLVGATRSTQGWWRSMFDSNDPCQSSEQPTRRPNKLGGLQHPSRNEKGNAAQKTRILAEGGIQGGGKCGAGSGESRGAEEGIWWDVPAAQGVTRGTEMSTYWPPCHVSASKEIATDGVPVHPAGRLGGEKISTEHPFPTNPDKAPRKQETKSPRQEAKRRETRDN